MYSRAIDGTLKWLFCSLTRVLARPFSRFFSTLHLKEGVLD